MVYDVMNLPKIAKNKGLNTNQILLGNGSDEVLDLLFRAFCEPKEDNVISWQSYLLKV